MTSLNISLPEALKNYVEGQVASGDWGTPSEYVRELIRQDKERRLGNLEQELVAALRPRPDGETLLELQATFRPAAESLEFGKTNYGFLAVRVAKNISAHFGGGVLTNGQGATGEAAIFGKPSRA